MRDSGLLDPEQCPHVGPGSLGLGRGRDGAEVHDNIDGLEPGRDGTEAGRRDVRNVRQDDRPVSRGAWRGRGGCRDGVVSAAALPPQPPAPIQCVLHALDGHVACIDEPRVPQVDMVRDPRHGVAIRVHEVGAEMKPPQKVPFRTAIVQDDCEVLCDPGEEGVLPVPIRARNLAVEVAIAAEQHNPAIAAEHQGMTSVRFDVDVPENSMSLGARHCDSVLIGDIHARCASPSDSCKSSYAKTATTNAMLGSLEFSRS